MPGLFTAPVQFPLSFKQSASQLKVHDLGGFDFHFIKVTGPTAYPNPAGIPFTANLAQLRALEWAVPICTALGLRRVTLDPVTGNIHVFVGTTGAEVANGVDLSADSFYVLCSGVR